jgi:dTDP-glucose 4,6-dehydratase
MKILITGGCGFIGSHYVDYIFTTHKDYQVVVVDKLTYAGNLDYLNKYINNPNFKFYCLDICNEKEMDNLFKNEQPDFVVNFAAESSVDKSLKDPDLFYNTNVGGVINLTSISYKHHVKRFLQVSTDEVYGPANGFPFNEKTPLNPTNPYSLSKKLAEEVALLAHKNTGLDVVITRSVNNYGSNQYYDKLIPLVIKNAISNKDIPIYGDGKNYRDWIYVDDNCNAIDLVLHNGKSGEIYNICAEEYKTNNEIVSFILNKLNKPQKLIKYVDDRVNHDLGYRIDGSKIRKELSFRTIHNFDDSLSKTIDSYVNIFKNNL